MPARACLQTLPLLMSQNVGTITPSTLSVIAAVDDALLEAAAKVDIVHVLVLRQSKQLCWARRFIKLAKKLLIFICEKCTKMHSFTQNASKIFW